MDSSDFSSVFLTVFIMHIQLSDEFFNMCCFYLFFLHNLKEVSTQGNSISEYPN